MRGERVGAGAGVDLPCFGGLPGLVGFAEGPDRALPAGTEAGPLPASAFFGRAPDARPATASDSGIHGGRLLPPDFLFEGFLFMPACYTAHLNAPAPN